MLTFYYSTNLLNPLDFRSLREVLSVNHCLAIVVSQAANPKIKADTSTNGAEQYNQQRLIMVKGTELPMEVDWVCFPLLGLSTHIREWSALNSMASHTLMPLAPYILKGAPVASSQYLKYVRLNVNVMCVHCGSKIF